MYILMKGTPFIYQGQELGMTNVSFPSIEDYDDAAIKYMYEKETSRGVPREQVMKIIWKKGRDNSRTPMQWSDEANGGFSDASPWLGVNPNHTWLNAASQLQDETSVYHFYKRLIALRKEHGVLISGTYELLLPNDRQIYAYLRKTEQKPP